jgi:hypothetical protein
MSETVNLSHLWRISQDEQTSMNNSSVLTTDDLVDSIKKSTDPRTGRLRVRELVNQVGEDAKGILLGMAKDPDTTGIVIQSIGGCCWELDRTLHWSIIMGADGIVENIYAHPNLLESTRTGWVHTNFQKDDVASVRGMARNPMITVRYVDEFLGGESAPRVKKWFLNNCIIPARAKSELAEKHGIRLTDSEAIKEMKQMKKDRFTNEILDRMEANMVTASILSDKWRRTASATNNVNEEAAKAIAMELGVRYDGRLMGGDQFLFTDTRKGSPAYNDTIVAPAGSTVTDVARILRTKCREYNRINHKSPSFLTASLRGEYWIIDGDPVFADGDVGDTNHSKMVLENLVLNEAASALDMNEREAEELWDRVVVSGQGFSAEEIALLKEYGMNDDAISTMNGRMDPRDYGLEHLGWARIKGNSIQVGNLNDSTLIDIAKGISEALFQEGDETDHSDETFSVSVGSTNKLFSDVPFSVLESGSVANLIQYDTRVRYRSSMLSDKWRITARKNGTASIPENWDTISMEPEKPEKGKEPEWRLCAGSGDWEAGWTLIAVDFKGHRWDSCTRIWMKPDYEEFPKGADNDQPSEITDKAKELGKAAAETWEKAARRLYKAKEETEKDEPAQWDECFWEALSDPSVAKFVKEKGKDKLEWTRTAQATPDPCPECHGRKRVDTKLKNLGTLEYTLHVVTCPTCNGKGYVDEKDHQSYLHNMGVAPCPHENCIHASASKKEEFIGVDLDGTLAEYDHWRGPEHIGEPVPKMLARVKKWLADGKKVKIFTARASGKDSEKAIKVIKEWCKEHIGQELEVTCEKDPMMLEMWDDRAVRVKKNKGTRVSMTRSNNI